MDDAVRNARLHRPVVEAMLFAAQHRTDLLELCAAVEGDDSSLRDAIMTTFGFDEVQADAILAMQVRRFTPRAIERYRALLAELDERIRGSGTGTDSTSRD
ncbi:hypothetical protein KNO15_03325 [Leifsonia shinshuensis]|uniref:hypothetical protein n=1 Tax=Leifsonia shinshuensis TaxID=150026 RepID=UPI001F514189|nr:hypothetical protein [Leifsonia shinshuensis]MCI0155727.1 hypothetical protein [Leifsonia shinshuensis]